MPNDYNKTVSLMRLLALNNEGRNNAHLLLEKLSEDRPVCARTLRRYLAQLQRAGFPVYLDPKLQVYRFPEGYSLGTMQLTAEEMLGLSTLRSLAKALGADVERSVEQVTQKLWSVSSSKGAPGTPSIALRFEGISLDEQGSKAFTSLQLAERSRRCVRFAYTDKRGAVSRRTVEPYAFTINAGRLYLIARDRTRDQMRTFAVDAIGELELLPTVVHKPAEFDAERFAQHSISGLFDGAPTATATLRFCADAAAYAKRSPLLRDVPKRELNNGELEADIPVAEPHELVRWVLGWGGRATIVTPVDLRAELHAVAARVCTLSEPEEAAHLMEAG